ncbi:hypothetical protein [Phytoactinopolyspora limicola]|uniref:acyl-CoA-like ligand-binding transcription factor n=1 Tax=Phytoactinopolyspora limicola TaxID=2715536 RepID=UPI00140E07C5|nr:hypothetical protein [Phytoactinopolyspora limicola]
MSILELWAANLDNITSGLLQLAEAVDERGGRDAADPLMRSFVGAVSGAIVPAWFAWAHDSDLDLAAGIDDALRHLEAGLPL